MKKKKVTRTKVKSSPKKSSMSPVIQTGIAFIFVAAIVLVAFVVKRYL